MIMVPDKAAGYLFSLFENKSSSMVGKKLFVDADSLFPTDVNKSCLSGVTAFKSNVKHTR